MAESFFAIFKTELLDGGIFDCHETAKSETFSYIEGYYNNRRPHSSIGNMSPNKFAAAYRKLKVKSTVSGDLRLLSQVPALAGIKINKTAQQAVI